MSEKPASTALPAHFYRDPMESAMRSEESSCKGCKSVTKVLGRELCGRGRRIMKKCKKYDDRG